jgi:hypothetical protein
MIMTSVEQAYEQWRCTDPLMRLRMAPIVPHLSCRWPRTETRVMNMICYCKLCQRTSTRNWSRTEGCQLTRSCLNYTRFLKLVAKRC